MMRLIKEQERCAFRFDLHAAVLWGEQPCCRKGAVLPRHNGRRSLHDLRLIRMQILQMLIGCIEPRFRQRSARFIRQRFCGVDEVQQALRQQTVTVGIRVAFGIAVILPCEVAAFQCGIEPLPQPDARQPVVFGERQHKAFAGVIVHRADEQQADDRRLRLTEQLAQQTFKRNDARAQRCLIDCKLHDHELRLLAEDLFICEQIAFH